MANRVLGGRLTAVAARAGYRTRAELIGLLGILQTAHGVQITSVQSVQYWLSGDRIPEPKHLIALLDALGVFGDERREIVGIAYPALQSVLDANRPPTPTDAA